MKTAIFLILCASLYAWGIRASAESDYCHLEAENYGSPQQVGPFPKECIKLVEKLAPHKARQLSDDGTVSVFGYRNTVIVRKKIHRRKITDDVIAGKFTEIKNVTALGIDRENDEVAVLDAKRGTVMFYSLTIVGNVAPFRILKHKEIIGADSVVIDPKDDETLVINSKLGHISVFSRLANTLERAGKKRLHILRRIEMTPR